MDHARGFAFICFLAVRLRCLYTTTEESTKRIVSRGDVFSGLVLLIQQLPTPELWQSSDLMELLFRVQKRYGVG